GIDGIYVDAEIAAAYGVREGYLIQKMEPGSMLDEAGLKSGDILLAVGDVRIFGAASIDRAMSRLSAGQSVTVLFLRNGVLYQTQMVAPGGAAAA
ncbi:MAG: PDZ domain-containing protein, partial [Clostridia bacterium]|nr:PDZ domain-containing protein [Clostridia bacterium]